MPAQWNLPTSTAPTPHYPIPHFLGVCSLSKSCIELLLVKKLVFRGEGPGKDHPGLLAIGSINGENSEAIRGHTQIEETRLRGESRRIGHQTHGKGVLKRLFDCVK